MAEKSYDYIFSKKNESRSLFKKCFRNSLFSFVPFEVWRDFIVPNADAKSIVCLYQTCWGFKELVDSSGENNNLALLFRKDGQIDIARKYLLKSAENNNATAMFQLGYGLYYHGWGLEPSRKNSIEWFRKSAENGNGAAMAYYAFFLRDDRRYEKHLLEELRNIWIKKALSSNDSFAIGFCYYIGLGTNRDEEKARLFFELASNEGNEIGQDYFASLVSSFDLEKEFFWRLKASKQGLYNAQYRISEMYREGKGCEKNIALSEFWKEKAYAQKFKSSETFYY